MPAPRSYNIPKLGRHDSAENLHFARELEQVRAKSSDIKYAELKGRMLVPVDNSVDTGAENITYNQYDKFGVAKIIANYATDFPRANVKGTQFTQAIKGIGSSYGYSIQEIRAAAFANKPLEQRLADAARKMIEDKIDSIAAVGDSANGLQGLLAVTNAQTYTVPNGGGGTPDFASKTPLEILKDLNGITHSIVVNTLEVEKPDTIILPLAQFADVSTRPMFSTGGSDVTVLKYFLQNTPYIKQVVPWNKAAGAGVASADRMVCYRKDPDALVLVIPQEFEQFPPEQKGMLVKTACHARCGGLQVFYPLSIAYGDGI